ncbi:WUSCHEL-related homeobox 8 [Olea europaea subsp. europaea]|uniref:WUSCHEL-related homeobox 8 n=1 Tax=Olea europaea subsp. europaea TaxID=158383 RepID=A0A8S0SXA2_OLEEU|nr:WUSCHEL-related homeobox 8 [Olea europaea subsp. europaea]
MRIGVLMEWEKQNVVQVADEVNNGVVNNGGVFVKVMTDEQIEILRKQIAVYASICEQLIHFHKSLTLQHDLAGARFGNLYYDPLMTPGGHKITGRQRWTPTAVQLQMLERIFDQGSGTPSKQKIKEITSELCPHGQISETNVYNWFQNRRARSKRKQQAAPPNTAEPEAETDAEFPNEKTTIPDDFQTQHVPSSKVEDLSFKNPEASSAMNSMDPPQTRKPESMLPPEGFLKHGGSFGQVPCGNMLSNPDHLIGKMEVPEDYDSYLQPDDFNMTG